MAKPGKKARAELVAVSAEIDRSQYPLAKQTLDSERLMREEGLSRRKAMAEAARRQIARQSEAGLTSKQRLKKAAGREEMAELTAEAEGQVGRRRRAAKVAAVVEHFVPGAAKGMQGALQMAARRRRAEEKAAAGLKKVFPERK